jgi:hypothetical protein
VPFISNSKLETYLHDAYRLGFLAAAAVALEETDETPKGNTGVQLDENFVLGQRANASDQ